MADSKGLSGLLSLCQALGGHLDGLKFLARLFASVPECVCAFAESAGRTREGALRRGRGVGGG